MKNTGSFLRKFLSIPLILFGSTALMYETAIFVLSAVPYDLTSRTAVFDDYSALSLLMISLAICFYLEICILHYCVPLVIAWILSSIQFIGVSLFLVKEFFFLTNAWFLFIFIVEALIIALLTWGLSRKYSRGFEWVNGAICIGFAFVSFSALVFSLSLYLQI